MISIELISKGENSLLSVLDSIKNQNFDEYEIICADSSGDIKIKNILKEYKCRVIDLPVGTPHLKARYIAHKCANGDKVIILDSTRPLKDNALSIIYQKYYKRDMVIIKEDSLGSGFWVKQAELLKTLSEEEINRIEKETIGFLLPRFYNAKILTEAFENVKKDTGKLFDKISYGEHHLIFEECRKISSDIVISDERLISHYEDDNIKKIIKKYYFYGKSQKILKKLKNSETKKLSTHKRNNVNIITRMKILPIDMARGIPFLLGYML